MSLNALCILLPPACMHPNSKGLHKGTFLQADIVGQLVAEVGSMHIVPDNEIIWYPKTVYLLYLAKLPWTGGVAQNCMSGHRLYTWI